MNKIYFFVLLNCFSHSVLLAQDECNEILFDKIIPLHFDETKYSFLKMKGQSGSDLALDVEIEVRAFILTKERQYNFTRIQIQSLECRAPADLSAFKAVNYQTKKDENLNTAKIRGEEAKKLIENIKKEKSVLANAAIELKSAEFAGPEIDRMDLNLRTAAPVGSSLDFDQKLKEQVNSNYLTVVKKIFSNFSENEKKLLNTVEDEFSKRKFQTAFEAKFRSFQGYHIVIEGCTKGTRAIDKSKKERTSKQ